MNENAFPGSTGDPPVSSGDPPDETTDTLRTHKDKLLSKVLPPVLSGELATATDPELAEALEIIRTQELAAMDDGRAAEIIRSLGAVEAWREDPHWSGLVEQQALFHRKPRP